MADVLEDKNNGFNAVRLLAAVTVVGTHSVLLLTPEVTRFWWAAYDAGSAAVNVFFVLSGLMLSRSFERNPDWRNFLVARLLRIFPGLIVAGFVVGWLLVPLGTNRFNLAYFLDRHTLAYPLGSAILFNNAHLHDAFALSPRPLEANLPLWTIKYELAAYFAFGIAVVTGLFRSRVTLLAITVTLGIAVILMKGPLDTSLVSQFARFGFNFMVGVSFYAFRHELKLSWPAAIGGLLVALAFGWAPSGRVFWTLGLGYAAVVLATVRVPGLTDMTNRWDISFGVYIYGWPIQQMLMANESVRSSLVLHAVATCIAVVPIAFASFIWVERPSIRVRQRLARVLQIIFPLQPRRQR